MQSLSQRKSAILECNSSLRQHLYALWSFNRLFLNVIYLLDNTSMPYDPFYSVDVRAEVCNQNAILTCCLETQALVQHRSLQVNYVFSTRTCAVVT